MTNQPIYAVPVRYRLPKTFFVTNLAQLLPNDVRCVFEVGDQAACIHLPILINAGGRL